MKAKVNLGQSGIMVHHKDTVIALDPSRHTDSHFTFVSHAHVDHLHKRNVTKKNKSQTLASKETALIAEARGYKIGNPAEQCDGFRLVDTGHILGSRGLLIEEEVYYTGDISMRERAFMKPAKVPHAKTLIIESTFGRPEYIFPPISEIIHKTNKIIAEGNVVFDQGDAGERHAAPPDRQSVQPHGLLQSGVELEQYELRAGVHAVQYRALRSARVPVRLLVGLLVHNRRTPTPALPESSSDSGRAEPFAAIRPGGSRCS